MQPLENRPSHRLEVRQQTAGTVLNSYLHQYLVRDPRKIAVLESPSVEKLDGMFGDMVKTLLPDPGDFSTLAFCQKLSDVLITKISARVQNAVLQDIEDTDDPVRATMGKRVFLLLNMRSILTATRKYFSDKNEDNEELLHIAMLGVENRISSIPKNDSVTSSISEMTHSLIMSHLASETKEQHGRTSEEGDVGSNEWIDLITDIVVARNIKDAFGRLSNREAVTLRLRFGLDDGVERTRREIGEVFGVDENTAERIERRALSKLRYPRGREGIEEAWELLKERRHR